MRKCYPPAIISHMQRYLVTTTPDLSGVWLLH